MSARLPHTANTAIRLIDASPKGAMTVANAAIAAAARSRVRQSQRLNAPRSLVLESPAGGPSVGVPIVAGYSNDDAMAYGFPRSR